MFKNLNFLDTKSEVIAYREIKNDLPKLLLIHGNMSSSVHFDLLADYFKNTYHIVAVDLRGFGHSSYNEGFSSLKELALDVKKLIEYLNFEDCYVLGWSTGGGVALELAALIKIKGLILVSSVGPNGYTMYQKDENGQNTEKLVLTLEEIKNDLIQVKPILDAYENKNKDVIKYIWDLLIYNNNKPDDLTYDHYLDEILLQRNLVDIDYSLIHFNITDHFNQRSKGSGIHKLINIPILLLHGENDLVVPITDSMDANNLFKNSKLVILKNCGHSPFTDDLNLVTNEIKKFIGGIT